MSVLKNAFFLAEDVWFLKYISDTEMFLALSPGSKSDQQESIVMKRQFDSWWNSSSWRLQIRNFWMVWVSRLIFPPLIWLLDKRGEGGYRQLMLRRSEVAVKGQEVNDGWDVALSTSWEEEERCLTHCCYGNLDRVCVCVCMRDPLYLHNGVVA